MTHDRTQSIYRHFAKKRVLFLSAVAAALFSERFYLKNGINALKHGIVSTKQQKNRFDNGTTQKSARGIPRARYADSLIPPGWEVIVDTG
ncbi:hypothetical protein [Dickeya dadantii]|uniref:hypothetical protein n=1 Tax=Dickeya dadantii TaxID=204038 RepID=UPI00126956C4|nr:hypothetical protein [Dickeya dadantii]